MLHDDACRFQFRVVRSDGLRDCKACTSRWLVNALVLRHG
jgi:hypothetical protein